MSAITKDKKTGGFIGFILTVMSEQIYADYKFNLPAGVTEIGNDIYNLHMQALWLFSVVGLCVFGIIIYSIINHRKSRGAKPANFDGNPIIEFIWAFIPVVMLASLAIPVTKLLLKTENTISADITIKVTGRQWRWEYEYQESGISLISKIDSASKHASQLNSTVNPRSVRNYLLNVDKELVVPVNKKIRILITSVDVIHAWWVPDLAVKGHAIPGHVNETWFAAEKTGVYRGQCTTLCGEGHGFMPIVVHVVEQAEYSEWLNRKKKPVKTVTGKVNSDRYQIAQLKNTKTIYTSDILPALQVLGHVTGESIW